MYLTSSIWRELDSRHQVIFIVSLSLLDGRMIAMEIEESPGSTEEQCRITSGGGNSRESAAENIPPF